MPIEAPPAPLLDAIRTRARGDILLVCDEPADRLWEGDACTARDLMRRTPEAGRIPCALVISAWLAEDSLEPVVARLRDLLADELYVLCSAQQEQDETLRALGLRLLQPDVQKGREWHLHYYQIRAYKRTPDWLTSRHWANPEMWNRFRW